MLPVPVGLSEWFGVAAELTEPVFNSTIFHCVRRGTINIKIKAVGHKMRSLIERFS